MPAYTTLTQELPSLPQEKKDKLAAIEKWVDDEFNDSTMTFLLSVWLRQRAGYAGMATYPENKST